MINQNPLLIDHKSIKHLQNMQAQENLILAILETLKNTKGHLFYTSPLFGPILTNFYEYMPTFQILTCHDPFFGAAPHIKVSQSLKDHRCTNILECQNQILKDPATVAYMKAKDPNPNVIIWFITPELQEFCRENGINMWNVGSDLFNLLANKVRITELLSRTAIPEIPNVCSKIQSYNQLLLASAPLNASSLVVQNQKGAGGWGTIFIASQSDYNTYQKQLQNGDCYKIMAFRHLKSFAIDGIATQSGVILGPLCSELIGHPQITHHRGGYCGNEIRNSYFQDKDAEMKVRRQIFAYSEKFGQFLRDQVGYRGLFGFDFVVDDDTKEVFFMEANPRLNGLNIISFQVYEAFGHRLPLFVFHCLEFMEVRMNLNVGDLNKLMMRLQSNEVSHITLKRTNGQCLPYWFPAGLWKLENNELAFIRKRIYSLSELQEDEIFFMPNRFISNGNILMRKRCQDDQFKLLKTTQQLIDKFIAVRFNSQISQQAQL